MAQQLDWMIVPNNNIAGEVVPKTEHIYDLYNLTVMKALCYGQRSVGVNLTGVIRPRVTTFAFKNRTVRPMR